MSFITRGFSFTRGVQNQVTNDSLHTLVDGCTVTAIALSEFAADSHLVQVSATVPVSDQGDGSFWYDTTLNFLRTKNGNARWDCPYAGPQMRNTSGSTIPKGANVVIGADGAGTVALCVTGGWPEVLGVAAATMADGTDGLIISKGFALALVVGPCTIGDVMITAGHDAVAYGNGHLRSLHATGVSSATLGIPCAQVFANIGATTALATCAIWR